MNAFSRFLFPALALDNRPQNLQALFLVGMVTPVVGGDGGVNLEMLDEKENPQGVMCVIDPYDDPNDPLDPMKVGDRLEVYWDTTLVGETTVRVQDINERLYLFLSTEPMVPDWAEEVFYKLTRVGSSTPEDSTALRLRVKLDRPGGHDWNPSDPDGHPNLEKPGLPPDLDLVDAEWAARGVPLEIEHYPNRSPRDLIQLKWGSVFVRRLISEDEASGTAPITLLIDQDTILAAGDSNALLVHYEVFDEVWNASTRYSKKTTVAVEAGAWRLDPPIIKEADSNNFIDLELLDKADVTIQIFASSPDFALGDTLTMIWTGTPSIGSPLINTQSKPIDNVPHFVEFQIPNAEIRAIAMGSGDVWYKLDKINGDPTLSSKHAFATVFGEGVLLPAPTIKELIGDTLEPDLPWATVQIPDYPGMAEGDWIDMVWLGLTAGDNPYPHEQGHPVTAGEVGEVIDIPVSAEHILALNGGSLDLFYRVSRDDVMLYGVRESDHLAVKVRAIQADLPKPRVLEAPDDVLDYASVTGPVTLRVDYLGTAAGDVLTYHWLGNPVGGTASDSVKLTTPSAGRLVDFRIKRALVDANINRVVKARYTLKRAASGQYSYSEVLDLLISQMPVDLPPPTVLQASGTAPNQQLNPVAAKNALTVVIPEYGILPADQVSVTWAGTAGAGSHTTPMQALPGSREIDLPVSVIAFNLGVSVTVTYIVTRNGEESPPSDVLNLAVQTIADDDLLVSKPRILEAANNGEGAELDLNTLTGNGTVRIDNWPLIAVDQYVWLRLKGIKPDNSNYDVTLWEPPSKVSSQWLSDGFATNVATNAYLRELKDGSTLTVEFKASFNQSTVEAQATLFPLRTYTVKAIIPPTLTDIRDSKGSVVDGITVETSVTVTGTGSSGQTIQLMDGANNIGSPVSIPATGTIWTTTLTGLTVKAYSIKAKALYGIGVPDSAVMAFNVTAVIAPTLSDIRDSKGSVVDGITVETSVTVTGTGSSGQTIQLMDGATNIGSPVSIPATGTTWTTTLTGLTVKAYSIKAKALYGAGQESAAKAFNVTATIAPTLTDIRDSKGSVVDGTTVETSVTVTGTGSSGQTIQLMDGTTNIGSPVSIPATGTTWTTTLTGLTVKAYSLKAKALYGAGQESATKAFNVTAVIAPTLTDIRDSKGSVVDGTTVETSVTVTGTGSSGQTIQLMDGATNIGSPVSIPATGTTWTTTLTGLTVKAYSLKAKALYGAGQESAAKAFNVTAALAPTLTDIRDSKGSVVDGTTVETSVTVTGTGSSGQTIQLMDGTANIGSPVSVPATGTTWTTTLTGLTVKAYSIKAKALYGAGQESAAKAFNVTAVIAPTLTDIRDSKGSVVGGTTVETSVTVTGTGSSGQTIQLMDGTTNIGSPVSIPATGTTWTTTLTGLTAKAYNLKAKALYGSGQESTVKTFNVAAVIAPTLTDIRDSKGSVVGGTTVETSVTVTGTGSSGQAIQLMDGATNIGSPVSIPATGTTWTTTLTGLTVKAYSLKAKALYGSGQESAAKAFNVTAVIAPTLTDIRDSKGSVVGGTTIETSVTVTGTGSSGQQIQLMDGATNIGSPVSIPATGTTWTITLTGLTAKAYSIKAKALYGSGQESAAKTFNVTAAIAPTLTDIRDSKGSVVGGTTVETSVTLTGTGSSGESIQLMDGATNIGSPVSIPATGTTWTTTLTGLTVKAYSIKAKALYGSGQESAAKAFNVTAVIAPTLTDIRDSKGSVVGGSTVETSVTVTGTGSSGQQIQLMDGATNIGSPVSIPATGTTWTTTLTGLTAKAYSIKAKALYGTGQESAVKTFNVTAAIAPTLTDIRDSKGSVVGGTTVETSVTVTGTGSSGESIQLMDGATNIGSPVSIPATGTTWTTTLTGLTVKAYSLKAKALYGSGQESAAKGFSVIARLVISPTPVTLSGQIHRSDRTPTNPPAGSYVDRTASGGTQPYTYWSTNPDIAEANVSTGRVIAKGTGSTTIIVYDAAGQEASYPVSCSNIQWYFGYIRGNYRNSNAWVQGEGGRLPTEANYQTLRSSYGGGDPGVGNWRNWILDPGGAPLGKKYVINPLTGQKSLITDWGDVPPYTSENADGYGVRAK
jgi:hypothetical protein